MNGTGITLYYIRNPFIFLYNTSFLMFYVWHATWEINFHTLLETISYQSPYLLLMKSLLRIYMEALVGSIQDGTDDQYIVNLNSSYIL